MNEDMLSAKEFFKTLHVPLSDEWLESCINWFQEQQEGAPYTKKELHCAVYEQWLLLDLREVVLPQLPANIQKVTKMILNKTLSLQMMSIIDIAKPKLQQLDKIKKLNLLTAGMEDGNETARVVGNRMLQLTLTDGVQEIKAIEYKPVSDLHLKLTPGAKVRITGPVTIRRGQIMLEQHNFKLLGGDVDDILISHSLENVLSRYLNLPENSNPRNLDESITNPNESSRSTQITQQNNGSTRQTPNIARKATIQNNIQSYMINTSNNRLPENHITPEEEEEMRIAQEVDMLMEAEQDIVETPKKVTKRTKTPDMFQDDFNPDDIPEEPSSTVLSCQPTTSKQARTEDIVDLDDDFFTSLEIDKHLDNVDEKIDENRIYTLKEVCTFIGKNREGKFTTYAKFKSVVQKLTVKDDDWHLHISIDSDDQAELVVKVDKSVITDMIGYTPLEVLEMKRGIQNKNPETANIIMKAIDNFKTQLLELNCLMQIEVTPTEDIPSIVKLV